MGRKQQARSLVTAATPISAPGWACAEHSAVATSWFTLHILENKEKRRQFLEQSGITFILGMLRKEESSIRHLCWANYYCKWHQIKSTGIMSYLPSFSFSETPLWPGYMWEIEAHSSYHFPACFLPTSNSARWFVYYFTLSPSNPEVLLSLIHKGWSWGSEK